MGSLNGNLRDWLFPAARRRGLVALRHADPWMILKYYQQSIPESVKPAAVALESEIIQDTKDSAKSTENKSMKVVQ